MIGSDLAGHAEALTVARQPFVQATVVRAQHPTSATPGDAALVLADGTIEGFVGGHCAEESVRLHALRAMEVGEPLLLRIEPEGGDGVDPADGAVTVHNPCLSGGALEIFLEPRLPAPRMVVVGDSPVAEALCDLGSRVGLEIERGPAAAAGDELALVVASHGTAEEPALAAALTAGVPYVALVASPRRGEAVRAALEIPDELRAQLRTPAGLAIGARTPPEIALSILADVVRVRRQARSDTAAPVVVAQASCCERG